MKKRGARSKLVLLLAVALLLVLTSTTLLRELRGKPAEPQNMVFQSWGINGSGQRGNGHVSYNNSEDLTPRHISLSHATATYGGLRHSLALTDDGRVIAWGSNAYGQVGSGKIGGVQPRPTEIKGLPKITILATKQDHSLALDDSGNVWTWGLNMSGQLGDGTNTDNATPRKVSTITDVKYIAAGYRSSVAVKQDGSVWVWGGHCNLENRGNRDLLERLSQLVLGGYNDDSGGTIDEITPEDNCIQEKYLNIKSYTPKRIDNLPPINSLSAGFGHVLALDKEGQLWSWGCNRYGQIGTGKAGSTDENLKPIRIDSIGKVRSVSAGFRHSLAIADDGQVWAWGHNYFGELGNGKSLASDLVYPKPAKVAGLTHMKFVAAGHDYSLAIGGDDRLYGWGEADVSQLSSNFKTGNRPLVLAQFSKASHVSAGGAHVVVGLPSDSVK